MRITEIRVDSYGAWHELGLRDLSDRVTVFYGPNEAGKTTLLNFVRTVLYGYSSQRCQRYLPPAQGARAGGALHVTAPNGRFVLERFAAADYQGGPGNVTIRSRDGMAQGSHLLNSLLSGVDETIFNNVFAVGLTQLQHLGTLSDTEAAQQLYGLATGTDRVSLFEVAQNLQRRRQSIISGEGDAEGELNQLLAARDRLQEELKSRSGDAERWRKLVQQRDKVDREIAQLEARQRQFGRQGDWKQIAEGLRRHWNRARELNVKLAQLGPLPDIPAHIAKRLEELNSEINRQRRQWENLRQQRRDLREKAQKLDGNGPLLRHAAEIEALDRQRPRIAALQQDVKHWEAQVEEREFELQAELEQLGLQTGTAGTKMPEISQRVIDALREPARETRELRVRVDAAKKAAESTREQAQQLQRQMETATLRFGGEDLAGAIERSERHVEQLRRRLQLDDHREQLDRRVEELQQRKGFWLERQVLPWRGILTVCAVFSVGAMLFFTGLFGDWFGIKDANGWMMMLVGGILSAVSLIIKQAFELAAGHRAEACQQQLGKLQQQQVDARQESEELDRAMPTGSGHLVQRLQAAETELAELEQLAPLTYRRQSVQEEAQAADRQVSLTVQQLKDARRRWKASLRAVGLPDSLTPTQIGQVSGRVGQVSGRRERLADARQELEGRRQELATICDRLDQLMALAERAETSESPDDQLRVLTTELKKHGDYARETNALRQQWETLRQQQARIAKAAARQMRARRQLLQGHGVSGVRDFETTMKRTARATKLRGERDQLVREISQGLGEEMSEQTVLELLDHDRDGEFAKRLREIDSQQEDGDSRLKALHERNGQLKQKLETLTRDRQLPYKQLELAVVQQRIDDAIGRWQQLAVTSRLLDTVRETYEHQRQPETLAEASGYLNRLTDGRYPRIWTPFGQAALCVDDRNGQALSVGKLSRGTREQVFLALRLALVAEYNRRGAGMPIILDDVFVNFDNRRASAAAEVLVDVAHSGQQLLVFTCHEHIKEIFAALDADVRDLPSEVGQVESPKPARRELKPRPAATVAASADVPSKARSSQRDRDYELPVYETDTWPGMDEAVIHAAVDAAPHGTSHEEHQFVTRHDRVESRDEDGRAAKRKAAIHFEDLEIARDGDDSRRRMAKASYADDADALLASVPQWDDEGLYREPIFDDVDAA